MAKKEDKNKDNLKGTSGKKSPEDKGQVKGPADTNKKGNNDSPTTSGKVKGPKGLGTKKTGEASTKAQTSTKAQPAAKAQATAKSAVTDKAEDSSKSQDSKKAKGSTKAKASTEAQATAKNAVSDKASTGKRGRPPKKAEGPTEDTGKTAAVKTTKTAASKKTSASDKPAKFKEPLTDTQLPDVAPPASKRTGEPKVKATGTTKTSAKTKAKKSEASIEKEPGKRSPKKMSRKKAESGISAEEKMKLSNTSTSDDLKENAKDLADKVIPDKETQEQIRKTAKDIIPDPDQVKKTAKKAKDMAEEILPNKEEVMSAAQKAKEKIKDATTDQKTEQHSSSEKPVEATLLSDFDIHLFKQGKHYHLYNKLGSHLMEYMGTEGVYFAVWAPNAEKVSVIGDFNNWNRESHGMRARWDGSGIWEVFIPEAKKGSLYKYFIRSTNGYEAEKGDPYAFTWETPPNTASVVWDLENTWKDKSWMNKRKKKEGEAQPYSVYEIHLGSWKRVPEEEMRSLTYRELAEDLPNYLTEMGFTHVEFMPVMEHPFFGSWGYQITGYFAPSSRFGTPQDFMHLIDRLHQAGIGVILDWVPSHFPSDLHGIHYFDGTHLYEHADPRKGFHPDWQSYIFNYGRNEVKSFLISNALFWLDKFHADGLRVDAVASMLYLDYSRKEGEWEPNEEGGRENLEAISFLKEFNEVVYKEFPDAVTIAEESTAWPMVSKPTYMGGLGFGMKWMMGWMHDTLEYFSKDPVHRRHHQNTITFSTTYAFSENFMLPLSHDEVVYGKNAILNKMPGDEWNKFANLRTLYAYMYGHPGTKLLFMGAEFGQPSEWNHDGSLEWHLTEQGPHKQVQETLKELNKIYKKEPALYEEAFSQEGFEWVDINDAENSIISFLRKGKDPKDNILIVCNFTPVPRENYRIGIQEEGKWKEIFNSDENRFGGSGVKNPETVESQSLPAHQKPFSLSLTLPPMGVVYLKRK